MAELLNDPRVNNRLMSQNVIVSLLVLSALHGGERRVTDIADDLGINRATAVRYLKTWVAVGILKQDRSSRRYRVAVRWRNESSGRSTSFDGRCSIVNMPTDNEGHDRVSADLDSPRPRQEPVGNEESRATVDAPASVEQPHDDGNPLRVQMREAEEARRIIAWLVGRRLPDVTLTTSQAMQLPLLSHISGRVAIYFVPGDKEGPYENGFPTPDSSQHRGFVNRLGSFKAMGVTIMCVSSQPLRALQRGVVIGAVDVAAPSSLVSRTQLVDDCGPHLLEATELISAHLASASTNGATPD